MRSQAPFIPGIKCQQQQFLKEKKNMLNLKISHNLYFHAPSSNTCAVNHLKSAFLALVRVHRTPLPNEITPNCIFTAIFEPGSPWKVHSQAPSDHSFLLEKLIWVFFLVHPRTLIGGRYILASPGKGAGGGWLKCPIRKTPIVPIKNTDAMTIKQTLSITRATRNHSSFSWINERFSVMLI